jgi:hypothetical protein
MVNLGELDPQLVCAQRLRTKALPGRATGPYRDAQNDCLLTYKVFDIASRDGVREDGDPNSEAICATNCALGFPQPGRRG